MNIEHLVLGGERVPAANGKSFAVIEPGLGEPFAEVAEAGTEDVELAVHTAYKAFKGRSTKSLLNGSSSERPLCR